MTTSFIESDLKFTFSPVHWQVKKYDAHNYYRILSGVGLKGVDFMGILDQETLVLFEVKNFHTHHPTQPPSYLLFEDTNAFVEHIVDKIKDTLLAIQVIKKHLQRKRWYRTFLRLERHFPTKIWQGSDWYFWHQAYQLMATPKRLTIVLWLEIDHHYAPVSRRKFKQFIENNLSQKLSETARIVEVANIDNPVFIGKLAVELQK